MMVHTLHENQAARYCNNLYKYNLYVGFFLLLARLASQWVEKPGAMKKVGAIFSKIKKIMS